MINICEEIPESGFVQNAVLLFWHGSRAKDGAQV